MVDHWRIIEDVDLDASTNMAFDEAILLARSQKLVPNTVRLYTWSPSAVSIGYFQSMEEEVDVEECKKLGVDQVRRITGGGAVFHARGGEVTYSIIVDQMDKRIPESFSESFKVLSNGLILGIRKIGLEVSFQPVNDLAVLGRKISGSAQTRRKGVILQHGTVLIKSDIKTMFKVLRVSNEKISDKAIKAVEERVTTIQRETGREIGLQEVREALREGFEESLNVKLIDGDLKSFEKQKAEELRKKYSSDVWKFRR